MVIPRRVSHGAWTGRCGRRRTMCDSGFHKWVVDRKKQFDVKQGRLVTVHRCTRCRVTKVTAD